MDPLSLTVSIESVNEQYAVLRNQAGEEFRWPVSKLPEDAEVGNSFVLKITTSQREEEEKYARMRRLLDELING